MNRRRHRLLLPLAAAFAALSAAAVAGAAEVVSVRTGAHPQYTRVVFELDGASGYRVERVGTDERPVLRVSLDATSRRAHSLRATGDVRGVRMNAGTRAVAEIALGRPGLRLQEMILSKPYRIVLDIMKAETGVAATTPAPPRSAAPAAKPKPAPAPKPVAEAKPTPAPKPVAEAKPAPVAPPPSKPAPVREPATAEPKPEPAPATAEPKPGDAPTERDIAAREEAAAPAPIPPAPRVPKGLDEPTPLAAAPEPTSPEAAPAPGRLPPAIVPKAPEATAQAQPPRPARAPKPAIARPVPAVPAAPASAPSWSERLAGDPRWIGGIAAALVGLLAVAFVLRRRGRTLPNDLDVTAIAEEVEQSGPQPSAGRAFARATGASDDETSFAGLFDEPGEATREVSAPQAAPAEPISLFDDADANIDQDTSQGEAPMNQEMDLPADPNRPSSRARLGGAAAFEGEPASDVARLLEQLERRISTLEAKLDEADEAREKLERQVAAQSEELRVQRAAIARTQRALRTMTRADEDKATEPALRDSDPQAKTRINV